MSYDYFSQFPLNVKDKYVQKYMYIFIFVLENIPIHLECNDQTRSFVLD